LKAAFARETAARTVVAAQIVYFLAIILYPLFGFLDYYLYPAVWKQLVLVRLVVVPVFILNLGVLFVFKRRGLADKFSRPLAWGMIYPACISLDLLIIIAGGAKSPYYAGLCLLLIAMLVSMPWGLWEMAAHAVFIWLQYLVVMVLFSPPMGTDAVHAFIGNNYFMSSTVVIGLTWGFTGYRMRVMEFITRRALAQEKERSEKLLLNILPASVAEELMTNGRVEAREVPDCTIVFTDFVGFTDISSRTPAHVLMRSLDRLFVGFDEVARRHGLEKLKTIGDAYMCAGGIPNPSPTHLADCVLAALEILDFLDHYRRTADDPLVWQVRIGIHSGPVTAGVIGQSKFAYDVWGDTVNTASRLESASAAGQINMATGTFERIAHLFDGVDRGHLPVKGKGLVAMTFVTGLKPQFATDELRRKPNQAFRELYDRSKKPSAIMRVAAAVPVDPTPTPTPAPVPTPIAFTASSRLKKETAMNDLLSCFSYLTEEDKRELRALALEVPFKEHEVLVQQGVALDALLVIAEGHAGVQVTIGSGKEASRIDVSVLGPGDLVGEMSFVSGERPGASVVGVEGGKVLRLPYAGLEGLMQRSGDFRARLYRSLASLLATRLRDTTSKLPPLITEDVAQVKRHHSTLTGRLSGDAEVPTSLLLAIDEFKQGMLDIDRGLAKQVGREARGGSSSAMAEQVRGEAAGKVAQLCDTLMAALSHAVQAAPDAAHADGIGAYTLRDTFASFMQSRMCDRSFSKPRGYAGDYYTIEMVYENRAMGDGRIGPLIDAWFLNIPAARAVRGRRALLKNLMLDRFRSHGAANDGTYRVLSIGSGSAREMFDMFTEVPEPAKVRGTCLDIDIEALNFGSHLSQERGLADHLLWAKENVIHLSKGRGQTRLSMHDFIYSMGLFDYLSDEVAVALLDWVYAHLDPKGVAVIGNFDPSCPDRAFMDHILDWRLYYRTPDDLLRLFDRSAFGRGSKFQVVWEENRVNHFILAERSLP
jgi:class 3 adenylate cyclase/CRP-like cAMP-binding protein